MRVTKTVREYIEREVRTRIEKKYEAEKLEAERQTKLKQEFEEGCAEAARKAWEKYFAENFKNISDFCEDDDCRPSFYTSRSVSIKDHCYRSSVHQWTSRCREECQKKTDEIIVELELGGTKQELMKMLSEI